jgi:CHASE3 domain sensor protein
VIGSEGSGSEIMTAFRQMMDEMQSQSAENRRLMESVVRAQENTVSISQKILRTAA